MSTVLCGEREEQYARMGLTSNWLQRAHINTYTYIWGTCSCNGHL